jgi:hypothetical protein
VSTASQTSAPHATDDVAQVSAVFAAFLSAVSFPPGGRPRYDAIPELFVEDGRLIKNSGDVPENTTVEEFIAPRQQQVDSGALTWFEEIEISHRTDLFGNVAHRVSAYAKRGEFGGAAIDVRGVIFTQFVRTPGGWRMSSMAWDDERPGLAIPKRYL